MLILVQLRLSAFHILFVFGADCYDDHHCLIPKVAFHPLNDINASDSILKYVDLQGKKNVEGGS